MAHGSGRAGNIDLETDSVSDCFFAAVVGIFTALCSTPRDSLDELTVRPGRACEWMGMPGRTSAKPPPPAPRPARSSANETQEFRFNLWMFPHLALPLHSSILGTRWNQDSRIRWPPAHFTLPQQQQPANSLCPSSPRHRRLCPACLADSAL
jgi:hypothetical protein